VETVVVEVTEVVIVVETIVVDDGNAVVVDVVETVVVHPINANKNKNGIMEANFFIYLPF